MSLSQAQPGTGHPERQCPRAYEAQPQLTGTSINWGATKATGHTHGCISTPETVRFFFFSPEKQFPRLASTLVIYSALFPLLHTLSWTRTGLEE